jgi:hypothetical protein
MGIVDRSLVKVTLDEGRYRRARPLLAGFGVVLVAIACAATALGWLVVSSAVAVGVYGAATILAAMSRRAATVATAAGAALGVVLVITSAVAAAHHAGGVFDVGLRDVIIFGVLGAADLLLLMWLHPDQLQGPEWRYRSQAPGDQR